MAQCHKLTDADQIARWADRARAAENAHESIRRAGAVLDAGGTFEQAEQAEGLRSARVARIARATPEDDVEGLLATSKLSSRRRLLDVLADPDGSRLKARHAKAGGRCKSCGKPTSYGSDGTPARLCRYCVKGEPRPEVAEARERRHRARPCGVPGCKNPKAPKRYVCATHGPTFDRIRAELDRTAVGGEDFSFDNHNPALAG